MIFKTIDFTNKDGSVIQKSAWTFGGAKPFEKAANGIGKIANKFTKEGSRLQNALNAIGNIQLPGANTKKLNANSLLNLQKLIDDADIQAVKDFNTAVQKEGVSVSEAVSRMGSATDETKRYCQAVGQGGVDIEEFSKHQEKNREEMAKSKKGFKGLSDSTKNMFKNIGAGILASAGIELAFKGVEWLYNELSGKNAIDKMNERLNDYSSAMEEVSSNTSSIRSLKNDFFDLSKGVDSTGKNIGLSAEEFDKYHEVVNKLAAISPSIVKGYDAEGNAIVDRTSAIKDAIKEQEEYKKQVTDSFTSNASGNDIIKGSNAQMSKDLKKARSEAKKIGEALGDTTNNIATLGPSSGKANIKTYSTLVNDTLGEQVDLENASLSQLEKIAKARNEINAAAKKSGDYSRDELNNIDSSSASLQAAVAQIKEDSSPIFQWLSTAMSYSAEEGSKSITEQIPKALQEGYQTGLKDIAASGKYSDAASLRQAGTKLGEDIIDEYNKDGSKLKSALDEATKAKEAFNKSQKDDAAVEATNEALAISVLY